MHVHLRINDPGTARPTPVRLRVTGPDGTHYAPFGRATEFPTGRGEAVGGHLLLGRQRWCYIDGSCEIRLPVGVPLRVQATKGPEFVPLDATVTLGPGRMAMRFTLTRHADLAADDWHAGDTRVHLLTPHDAALEGAAEGVAVVNLLVGVFDTAAMNAGKVYPLAANQAAFSGQEPTLERHGTAVVVNTFNAHPVLGRVGLLNCHRPVFPLTFGGADDTDDWSICDWCDQCHRKNGLTTWVNPFEPAAGVPGGEALVALLLGKIDAVEADTRRRREPLLPWYYRLWNAGFAVPLVGGSGKDTNATPVGGLRAVARLPAGEPLTYAGWIEAVRAGRCFATNGPLLRFAVTGAEPGGTADAAAGTPMRVTATATSIVPFDNLEVVADGLVVAATTAIETGGRFTATLEFEHTPKGSGWLAARVSGPPAEPLTDQLAFAHTTPIRLRVDDTPLPRRRGTLPLLRQAVELTRRWVVDAGRFEREKSRTHLLELCDQALARIASSGGVP